MKSKFFIDRPILSIALAVMMAIVGIVGYVNLPVEQFPDMAPPIVEVSADYPGASAEAVCQWCQWYRLYQFLVNEQWICLHPGNIQEWH